MAIGYEIGMTVRGPLANSREAAQIIAQEVRRGMQMAVSDLERMVRIGTPAGVGAGGGLRGSIAGEVRGIGLDIHGIVGSPLGYAPVVELGRRPGQKPPPYAALLTWVRRIVQPHVLGVSVTTRRATRRLPADQAEARIRGVAIAIAKAIGRRGIPGRFMFRDAKAEFERARLPRIAEATSAAIAERLGGRQA